MRKPVFGVSDQVRQKPGPTATEIGSRLEIPDRLSIGICAIYVAKTKTLTKTADLRLCFRMYMQKAGLAAYRTAHIKVVFKRL